MSVTPFTNYLKAKLGDVYRSGSELVAVPGTAAEP